MLVRHWDGGISYSMRNLCIGIVVLFGFAELGRADPVRVRITAWNLQWFPDGSARASTFEKQAQHIQAAADVLKTLNPDILLLQEVRDYDACARLGEAVAPQKYQVAICSAFKGGRQQEAILAKTPAQAAWAEPWKSTGSFDPPRGLAFAWFKIGNANIGVYSLHLKSNLITKENREMEMAKNIQEREVAVQQLLAHVHDVIATAIPSIKGIIIGGDFNTNHDQTLFTTEKTLNTLTDAAYANVFEGVPFSQRITHPANHGFPDATFDYFFGKDVKLGSPIITPTKVSDHFPVTCDIEVGQ
jgi:endonuclease/exonuclease/phosphatase family metal-dependent hydrolase